MLDVDETLVEEDGTTYYPLRKAAEENARHLYEVDSPGYGELVSQNMQMFRKWLANLQVKTRKVNNELYVPEEIYNVFVDLVRNKHAVCLLKVSKSTMARLKASGILAKIKIPGTKTTFVSYKQLSDSKTIHIVERRRRMGNKLESVIPIDRLKYYNLSSMYRSTQRQRPLAQQSKCDI